MCKNKTKLFNFKNQKIQFYLPLSIIIWEILFKCVPN